MDDGADTKKMIFGQQKQRAEQPGEKSKMLSAEIVNCQHHENRKQQTKCTQHDGSCREHLKTNCLKRHPCKHRQIGVKAAVIDNAVVSNIQPVRWNRVRGVLVLV